jgi:hypothetical protein
VERLCELKNIHQVLKENLCALCVKKGSVDVTAYQRMDKTPSKIIFNKIIKTK